MGKTIVDETLKFEVVINGDKAKKEYGQLERSTKKLLDRNSDLEEQAKKLKKSRKDEAEALKKIQDEIEQNNRAIQKNEGRLKDLTKEIGINNLSLTQLRKEYRRLNSIVSNLDPGTEKWNQYNDQLKSVKSRMSELRSEMRPVQDDMQEQLEVVDGLTGGFKQFFGALATGDIKTAKIGLDAIGASIKNATKAALAFIATPLGASIALLAGIGLAAKELFNYNNQAREAIILTQQITGLQGEQANAARIQAQAISDTFDTDFKETLETARNLSRQFNISFVEALDEIEAGLVRGQKNNNEYFDSLREYPTFFAQAGFSASEFRRTIETGYDLGIYTDKLPDAIKEVDISLREQTKSTVEALKNAFGAAFTDELLNRVRKGEITTKQALAVIANEAEKTGLNVQQNAQLTADLFRGAGEDAGGAIVVLNAFNQALNETGDALTPLEEMIQRVADANQRLAEAQDEALKSDKYLAFSNDIKIFWADVKTQFFRGVKFIVDQFDKSQEVLLRFTASSIATFNILPTVAKNSFAKLKDEVFDVLLTFKGMGDVIENLLNFNFAAAKDSFNDFKKDFKSEVSDVKGVATDAIDTVLAARRAAADFASEKLKQRREAAAAENNQSGPQTSLGGIGTVGSNGREGLTAEDQKKLDSRKRLAELIDQFEAERKIQEQIKLLEKEKRAEEEEILRIEQKFAKLQEQANGEKELLARLETEKQAQINDVRKKFSDLRIEQDKSEKDKLLEFQRKYTEDIILLESALTKARKNAALQGLNILRGFVNESSGIAKALFLIQQGIAINDIIRAASQAVAVATANEAKIPAFIPTVFGTIPNVLKPQSLAATAKSIATTKTTALTEIGTILAQTIQGFEDGLYPVRRAQDGRIFQSRFGGEPRTQVVTAPTQFIAGEVKPEMIIDGDTFKKMDPAVTSYIMSLAGRSPGFEGGIYPGDSNNNETLMALNGAIMALNERLKEPFIAENYYGADASRRQREVDEKLRQIRNNAKLRRNAI